MRRENEIIALVGITGHDKAIETQKTIVWNRPIIDEKLEEYF
jgi:hypothetical protein